jgi:hypothetical protein
MKRILDIIFTCCLSFALSGQNTDQGDPYNWKKERKNYDYSGSSRPQIETDGDVDIPIAPNEDVRKPKSSSVKRENIGRFPIDRKTLEKISKNRNNPSIPRDANGNSSESAPYDVNTPEGSEDYEGGNTVQDESDKVVSYEPPVESETSETKRETNQRSSAAVKWIMLSLLVIGIGVGFYIWLRNRKIPLPSAEILADPDPVDINISDLERMLSLALEQQNFREAIRIHFTFILKELSNKKLISWHKEKTNLHYIRELSQNHLQKDFFDCVSIYDSVWYGQYHLNEQEYSEFSPVFSSFYENVMSSK